MYILNIAKAIKKMTVKELKGFIFENYYLRLGFAKENSYYSMKRRKKKRSTKIEKIRDPCNTINHFSERNNTKLVKQSEIIIQKSNPMESPNFNIE